MNQHSTSIAELWLALLHISPMPGNEAFQNPESMGGYVNSVAYALDEQQFLEKILRTLSDYGMRLIAIENASLIGGPLEIAKIEPRLIEGIRQLSTEEDAWLGTLFAYSGSGPA